MKEPSNIQLLKKRISLLRKIEIRKERISRIEEEIREYTKELKSIERGKK